MQVRLAKESDHAWIKARYEQSGFLASQFSKETIAVAELNGKKAGVGRLVPIDSSSMELGGLFVEEYFRGEGVAKKVIDFLLATVPEKTTLYCVALSALTALYEDIGFEPCTEADAPKEMAEKFLWTQKRNTQKVVLMVRKQK